MSAPSSIVTLDSYLSLKDVMKIVTVGSSTIYRWIEEGSFPRPRQLGANCVRWRAADIKAWQESRPTTDREAGAPSRKRG